MNLFKFYEFNVKNYAFIFFIHWKNNFFGALLNKTK